MQHSDDILRLLIGAHALTRVVAGHPHRRPSAQWRTLVLLRDNGPLRIGDLATLSRSLNPG
jgi:hypothetical protein